MIYVYKNINSIMTHNKTYYSQNIIDSKKHIERIEKTKLALFRFKNYYAQHRFLLPEEWGINSFQEFINIITSIYQNKDLMQEEWFKEYHNILFIEFLIEFRKIFKEYTAIQFGRGNDDFVLKLIKILNQKLITPLEEMKQNMFIYSKI